MKKRTWKTITGRVLALMMAATLAGSNVSYAAVPAEPDVIEAEEVNESEDTESSIEENGESETADDIIAEATEDNDAEILDVSEEAVEPSDEETEFLETASDSETVLDENEEVPAVGEDITEDESEEADVSDDAAVYEAGKDVTATEAFAGDEESAAEVTEEAEEAEILDTELPQLQADEQLVAPTDIHWDPEVPARYVFKAYADQEAFYFAEFYKDGRFSEYYDIGDVKRYNPEESSGYYLYKDDIFVDVSDLGSGTYKFRVKAGLDSNDDDFETGAVSEWSEDFVYTEPEIRLADPQNVRWSSTEPGVVLWDAVPNGSWYIVNLYIDGKAKKGRTSQFGGKCKTDISSWIGDVNEHEYKVSVKAIPENIYEYAASNESFSEPLNQNVSGQTKALTDAENAVIGASSREEAEHSIRDLWNEIDIDEMKLAMQTKEDVHDAVQDLEDAYTGKADININTIVTNDAGINAGKDSVSILGAGLNATAGSNVTFTIDKADAHDDHIIDTKLWVNVTRFDMDIDGVVTDSEGNLMFPVTVTMPVPANVKNLSTMRILHYHHSDNGYDLIEPRINSDGTASFTVTHFSEFVFAEEKEQTVFTDVPLSGKYYSEPVYWAAENEITKGYSDGSFGVGRDCQRRELMIFLWRYAGKPTGYGDARTMFNDLSAYGPNSATNKAIAWAYKTGISKGYSDGGFHPEASIVRKDVMIMLYRLAGKPKVSGSLTFTDCKNLKKGTDTYNAILWGSNNGITKGYTSGQYSGMFGNNLNCLREQIVTFLYRYALS